MNLGTFDDTRRLEKTLGSDRLAKVMLRAAPGWFSDRSWEFWRGRLALALGKAMPEEPPRRAILAAISSDEIGTNERLPSDDGILLGASLDDLMATKLKATLDRAEARDYRDIAQMIAAGVPLSSGLGAFKRMFNGEPSQVLRAIGYFRDGDLPSLAKSDQELLRNARDQVIDVPEVNVSVGPLGDRTADDSTLT
jgi:hypothetical protein